MTSYISSMVLKQQCILIDQYNNPAALLNVSKALGEILNSAFGLHALINLCQLDCAQKGATGKSRKYDLQRKLE